ncbi:MAG: hypothetical protein KGH75_01445 [Rhodospirillales bacterium]|nr:hypothetical protein [Rhodospirillales bacterium]
MGLDYRREVKKILQSPDAKTIIIHIPRHQDITQDDSVYQATYEALTKNNAAHAVCRLTSELHGSKDMDLHDYFMKNDLEYEKIKV